MARLVTDEIEQTLNSLRRAGISRATVNELALQGLATIYHASRRGNVKASMWLAERLMGQVQPDYPDQVDEIVDPAEARAELRRHMTLAGFDDETATKIVDVIAAYEEPEPECPLDDLPVVEAEYWAVEALEDAADDLATPAMRAAFAAFEAEEADREDLEFFDNQDDSTV